MWYVLWLLLPVAALSGWWIGKKQALGTSSSNKALSRGYFQGLNFLLNEQPDRAIDVFIRLVELDEDTIETHLALGYLFRRRGEVDRAIRIHQNLIARPSLDGDQRSNAILELGRDYLAAGLFDRAESLFKQAMGAPAFRADALRHLLDVYQQEKEWESAITTARRLQGLGGERLGPLVAQFACELAELKMAANGEMGEVRQLIKRAFGFDSQSVRASLLLGDIEQQEGRWRAAIKAYQRVESQDVDFVPEVLGRLETCYQALGQTEQYKQELYKLLNRYTGVSVILKVTDLIAADEGKETAAAFLAKQVGHRPSVRALNRLLSLTSDKSVTLEDDRVCYRCRECGFEARQLHWLCPSCRSWATIKPLRGVQGE
ncbi:lipopolysaccharide assembly protein LapB [Spiribacter sp. C176]|uniref:Lipopolysaccharide assembly protein B n=1 Tax=Spiribacter salilacus TaxID=2664894 RepID=A0A6N7QLZ6_9GAMM|nr:lipopolysaccharide assembly protein LapB [Spiribacter salilacus]MRH77431.1 lipopolysaccharide assembly protein LapB [Spiribacter salilacus]